MKHNPSLPARALQTSGMVPGLPVVCDPAVVLATWAGVLPRGDNENSMGRHCNEVGGVERLRLGRARALVALGRSRRPGNDDRPDGTVGTPLDPWHLPAHSPGLRTVVRATTEQTKRQVRAAEEALGTRIWVAIP